MNISSKLLLNAVPIATALLVASASAQMPSAGPDERVVIKLHAEGAQIYECKPDSGNPSAPSAHPLTWQFREPVATLIVEGKTVGRHYAGPNWDHIDGSGVNGKVVGSAPGVTPNDIPWLKLEVAGRRGNGILSDASTVLRVNTTGGMAKGSCESAGKYLSVPYAADYLFLRKGE
jgi:hypothetical protein